MEALTSTQKTVFSYITKHLDKKGIPPTLDEIAVNFHYKSINSVRSHLRLIEKKGYIRVHPGKSRGIQVLKSINDMIWTFTNLFPGCLIRTIDSIRAKKKFFWDYSKNYNRHWLATNMSGEAFLGFHAFNTKKITGKDTIDFIKYRQLIAQGLNMDDAMFEAVLAKPKPPEE